MLTVNASDADSGQNARIRYSLVGAPVDAFYINSDTGVIFTNRSLVYNHLHDLLHLVVKAEDSGRPPLSTFAPITIQILGLNSHAPKFVKDTYT